MRALATTRYIVFLTRRAGGADAVLARLFGASAVPVGRRSFGQVELEGFLAQMAATGVEVVESAPVETIALPAPTPVAAAYEAPRAAQKPVESTWLSLSDIVLKTQKIRGPNVR
jgi:hypothetical protein